MEQSIDISQLKSIFFNKLFREYMDFIRNTSLNPDINKTLNKTLSKLDNAIHESNPSEWLFEHRVNKEGKEVYPYIKTVFEERAYAASVEEFFDLFKGSSYLGNIYKLLTFMTEGGSLSEMKEMQEDVIIRQITYYFWGIILGDRDSCWGNEEITRNEVLSSTEYYKVINGPLKQMLGGYFHFTNFINLIRKIRNEDIHEWKEICNIQEGRLLMQFKFFVYIGTVLFLRDAIGTPYEVSRLLIIQGAKKDTEVSLWDKDGNYMEPKSGTNNMFRVSWYKNYRIMAEQNISCDYTPTWLDQTPIVTIKKGAIVVNHNDSEMNTSSAQVAWQDIIQDINLGLDILEGIKSDTEEINDKLGALIDIKKKGDLKLHEILQKLLENHPSKNGKFTWDDVYKLLNLKETERQNSSYRIAVVIQCIIAFAALLVLCWSINNDASLIWTVNKAMLSLLSASAIIVTSGLAIYATRFIALQGEPPSSDTARNKRNYLSIALATFTFVTIAVSFLLIPGKTIATFVDSYDFSKHSESDNKEVVDYMEDLLKQQPDDERLMIQLSSYYLHYANNPQRAMEIIDPMRDSRKYKEGAVAAAEVLLEGKKYLELIDLMNEYKDAYGFNPIMLRLEGITHLFGYGREQDVELAKRCFNTAAYKGGDVKSFYYLGYTSSHDVNNYHEGEPSLFSYYDLSKAAEFFRIASSKGDCQSSLSLGKIYADLNVVDSASFYYRKAIEQSRITMGHPENRRINLASEFHLGILLEENGSNNKDHLRNAIRAGYDPAILYSAIKEGDHWTAIERYKKMGEYKGYRYLPPIFFEYLAIGDSVNALNSLEKAKKDACFNMDFVSAVQRILGSPFVKKDSLMAQHLMRSSAQKGCLFAKMFTLFREMEPTGGTWSQHDEMEIIAQSIPFGHSLNSWLLRKTKNNDFFTVMYAQMALQKGHPSGALMIAGLGISNLIEGLKQTEASIEGITTHIPIYEYYAKIYQQTLRMISNNRGKNKLSVFKEDCFTQAIHWILEYYSGYYNLKLPNGKMYREEKTALTTSLVIEDMEFWGGAAIANHFYDAELLLANFINNSSSNREASDIKKRLLMDAFDGIDSSKSHSFLEFLSTEINIYGKKLVLELNEKYKHDNFKLYVLNSGEYNKIKDVKNFDVIYTELNLELKNININHISDEQIILELSDMISEEYEYSLNN